VRIYSVTDGVAGAPRGPSASYACLFRNGSTVLLVGPKPRPQGGLNHRLAEARLAGTTLAYTEVQFGIDSGCTSIHVIDVTTRRALLTLPQVACFVDAGFVRAGWVTDLVVNRRGSVAWIAAEGRQREESFEVRRADVAGQSVLLDEGAKIAPRSLQPAPGGEVSWLHGVRARYAPLG
jgi:hypothetical protein